MIDDYDEQHESERQWQRQPQRQPQQPPRRPSPLAEFLRRRAETHEEDE